MTLSVEEEDYRDGVEKALKEYRKKTNIPGFRPGMAPMGLIKRQYGTAVKVDTINKIVGEKMYDYIKDNKIQMLGEPLPSDKQEAIDIEGPAPYTFIFDIAVAPEFSITLSGEDTIDCYTIKVDDKAVDDRIDMLAARAGRYEKVDNYEGNDMLKGTLRELDAEGNVKTDGITAEDAVLMPMYIKVEEQEALFEGAKLGDTVTFNPKKAYPENDVEVASLLKKKKEEVADLTSDFAYQITEISRFTKAPVDQDLFDMIYGEDVVTSEEQFREKLTEQIKYENSTETDFKLLQDIRKYCEDKVGDLTFPEALLKRVMLSKNKGEGAEEKIEKNFELSLKELKWHLIKEQLIEQFGIKINDEDVKASAKEFARIQYAQYGMNNLPDEYIERYADDLLKKQENLDGIIDRSIDNKIEECVKNTVKLNNKEVTADEFNKLINE